MAASVDYRETLVVYLRSDSNDAAAKSLNITKASLFQRLQVLRESGVQVPRKTKRPGLGALEVAQLNSLIKKYEKEAQGVGK